MARGTDFGGVHSHRNLRLIQQTVELSPAEPKFNLVDIPGADGSKDLSTMPAGRVTFKDRTIKWIFALYPGDDWEAKHRLVSNHLNGLACRITLDSNPDYYYLGRLAVRSYKLDKTLRQITVEAVCRPYMLKQQVTVVTPSLTTEYQTFVLQNDRMSTIPTIITTKETSIKYGANEVRLSRGTHKLLDFVLEWGANTIQAKVTNTTGTVRIEYQEGSL